MNDGSRLRPFPFSALVGQEAMRRALLLNAVDPRIGGLMIMGHRGTAKTTAVRGLAQLLPKISTHEGCAFRCDPADDPSVWCATCRERGGENPACSIPVPVVDLPLGATEDRVAGTMNLESALLKGKTVFQPGLLATAHRGFLYIDEVNLLDDHLVDLLLDVAAGGINRVERESVSAEHPARFVLIGTGNPEEGDLRPQLLDRFGLSVRVITESDPDLRRQILERRLAFEDDRESFCARFAKDEGELRDRILAAQASLPSIELPAHLLELMTRINGILRIDGHRGELALARASRALAAWDGVAAVDESHVRQLAESALGHRLQRTSLDAGQGQEQIGRAVEEALNDSLERGASPGN